MWGVNAFARRGVPVCFEQQEQSVWWFSRLAAPEDVRVELGAILVEDNVPRDRCVCVERLVFPERHTVVQVRSKNT